MLSFLAVEKFDVLCKGGCRVKKWHARLSRTLRIFTMLRKMLEESILLNLVVQKEKKLRKKTK